MTPEENSLHKYEDYSYKISVDGATVTGKSNYDDKEQTITIRIPEPNPAKDLTALARDICKKLSVSLRDETLLVEDSHTVRCRIRCNENTSSWIWSGGNKSLMP